MRAAVLLLLQVSGTAAGTAAALSRCGRPERRSSCAREEENERRAWKNKRISGLKRWAVVQGGWGVTSLSLPCAMMASSVLRGAWPGAKAVEDVSACKLSSLSPE